MIDRDLIDRFHAGDCTEEEIQLLRKYLMDGKLSEQLEMDWEEMEKDNLLLPVDQDERMRQRLIGVFSITTVKGKRIRNKRVLGVAAVMVLLLVVITLLRNVLNTDNQIPKLISLENTKNEVLEYELEDNSHIWLNSGSKIRFYKPFENDRRWVNLEGEAFFKVETDSTRPFIVESGAIETIVLGTAFNVLSLANGDVKVALQEGSVKLRLINDPIPNNQVGMHPGNLAVYDKIKDSITLTQYNENDPFIWRDRIIVFNKAGMDEIAQTLERWYQIPFEFKGRSVRNDSIVYKINFKELTLDQVLSKLNLISTNYELIQSSNKKKVYIIPKQISR